MSRCVTAGPRLLDFLGGRKGALAGGFLVEGKNIVIVLPRAESVHNGGTVVARESYEKGGREDVKCGTQGRKSGVLTRPGRKGARKGYEIQAERHARLQRQHPLADGGQGRGIRSVRRGGRKGKGGLQLVQANRKDDHGGALRVGDRKIFGNEVRDGLAGIILIASMPPGLYTNRHVWGSLLLDGARSRIQTLQLSRPSR